jgi:hypothetical protein
MPDLAPRPLPVTFIKETGENAWYFRRYLPYDSEKCPAGHPMGNCDSLFLFDHRPSDQHPKLEDFLNDPRWPKVCDACHRPFSEMSMQAQLQIFTDAVMVTQSGERRTFRQWNKVPGIMWDQTWLHDSPASCGHDGLSLCVVCPDGAHWGIDGRALNCTDKEGAAAGRHKCWVRHGTPPGPIHVDKNGPTCSAGAGSIQTDHWHGFLTNGMLQDNR